MKSAIPLERFCRGVGILDENEEIAKLLKAL